MDKNNLLKRIVLEFIQLLSQDNLSEDNKLRLIDDNYPKNNNSLREIFYQLEAKLNQHLASARDTISKSEIQIIFSAKEPKLRISDLAKTYNNELLQQAYVSVHKLVELIEDRLKYYFSVYAAYECIKEGRKVNLLDTDKSRLGEVYILELFVNRDLIGDIQETNQNLVNFILDLCAAVNRIMSKHGDWQEKIRKDGWKKNFLQLLMRDDEISQKHGDKLGEYVNEVVKIFMGTVNDSRVGSLGIDQVIEKLFKQHIILEIFCFRRLAEAGLSIIPKIRMKGGEIEADLLIIIDENEACVVEVTSRKQIPDDKLIQMEKSCNYIKNMEIERLGNIIICSKETELKARLERINFNELNDKCKILSKVYGVVSSS